MPDEQYHDAPTQALTILSDAGQRRWIIAYSVAIPLAYALFFLLTWTRVGPKDFDQFLVFHELQYWNHALFGFAKQWTPLLCTGLSMAGEPQIPQMSLSMLLGYVVGAFNGVKLACLVYLALGWCGGYLYAGLWQTERLTRALAASLFVGNGFFFYRLAHGHNDFMPFLVLPLAVWALHQSLVLCRRNTFVMNALHTALLTAAYGGVLAIVVDGSPVAMIHLLLWLTLYAVVLAYHARSVLPLAILSAAIIFASILDAGYLWPMLSAQAEFPRLTRNVFTDPTGLLVHAVLPLRGKITHGLGKGHEMTVFIGPVLAALIWHYRHSLRASMPTSMFKPLVVVSVVSIILGMGSLHGLHVPEWLSPFDLLRPLPGFRSIGVTARYWGFLALPLSLWGAVALRRFVSERPAHTVSLWLSVALILQLGAQGEAFWAKWKPGRTRIYAATNLQSFFHGHPESVSYLSVSKLHMQGEFITPCRGIANCYDMDDFVRTPVQPGLQLISSQVVQTTAPRTSKWIGDENSVATTHPLAVTFDTWNHIHLHDDNSNQSIPDHALRTVILNQAWNSHWSAPGCTVSRSEQNQLTVRCPEQQFRTVGVDLLFEDELSSVSTAVSRRAWRWYLILVCVGLITVAMRRSWLPEKTAGVGE